METKTDGKMMLTEWNNNNIVSILISWLSPIYFNCCHIFGKAPQLDLQLILEHIAEFCPLTFANLNIVPTVTFMWSHINVDESLLLVLTYIYTYFGWMYSFSVVIFILTFSVQVVQYFWWDEDGEGIDGDEEQKIQS